MIKEIKPEVKTAIDFLTEQRFIQESKTKFSCSFSERKIVVEIVDVQERDTAFRVSCHFPLHSIYLCEYAFCVGELEKVLDIFISVYIYPQEQIMGGCKIS